MRQDIAAVESIKQMLNEAQPLDLVAQAISRCGPWIRWTFQRQLWYLRRHARLTQAELALRSGVTQARISRIESGGDVKLSTLRILFAALGYEPLVLPDKPGRPREDFCRKRRRGSPPD